MVTPNGPGRILFHCLTFKSTILIVKIALIFSILFLVIENISAQAITINIDSEQNTQKTFDGYVNKIVVSSGRQSFC